jgi:hypothetical protein
MQPSDMDSDSESDARTLYGKEAKFPSMDNGRTSDQGRRLERQ